MFLMMSMASALGTLKSVQRIDQSRELGRVATILADPIAVKGGTWNGGVDHDVLVRNHNVANLHVAANDDAARALVDHYHACLGLRGIALHVEQAGDKVDRIVDVDVGHLHHDVRGVPGLDVVGILLKVGLADDAGDVAGGLESWRDSSPRRE